MSKKFLNSALKIVGLFALSAALFVPAASAATARSSAKRAIAKAPHAAKSTSAKKIVSSRRNARFESLARRPIASRRHSIVYAFVPAVPSFGQIAGLHGAQDPLDLKSSVALVIDQETREVLFSKNDHAVLPIASLTKLMTGVIISGAKLPMDETKLKAELPKFLAELRYQKQNEIFNQWFRKQIESAKIPLPNRQRRQS